MIGDKSICKIVSYMRETRTFIVEEIASKNQGLLPLSKDISRDKVKLFDAMKQGRTILLLCIKVVDGKSIFSSNMHALDEKHKKKLFPYQSTFLLKMRYLTCLYLIPYTIYLVRL